MLAFSLLTLLVFVAFLYARREGCLTPLKKLLFAISFLVLGVLWVWIGITSLQ